MYRLATTLLDDRQHPAAELVTLYHQRWEIETAYLELKSSILGGRVLRARAGALVQIILFEAELTEPRWPEHMRPVTGLPAGRALPAPSTTVLAMAWHQC